MDPMTAPSVAERSSAHMFLGRLVDQWLGRLEQSRMHRAPFMEVAKQCSQFYGGASDFMWSQQFRSQYLGNIEAPKFRVTINKAFELVALFGPYLFWKNPNRYLRPYKQIKISPELFGSPDDPLAQMMYQQFAAQQHMDSEQNRVRCELMESWLNYTPREQPGTLATHAQLGITEALIKGRGLLWPEHFCLGSATRVYAQSKNGVFTTTVRDLHDMHSRGGQVQLWDGRKWTKMLSIWKSQERSGLSVLLRSGERISCTVNHKWPTQRGLLQASDLRVGDVMESCTLAEPECLSHSSLLSSDVGWIVGHFIAEGCVQGNRVHLSCHRLECDEVSRKARVLVGKFGGSVHVYSEGRSPQDNCGLVVINSRVLVSIIKEFVSGKCAKSKHLRNSAWRMPNEFLSSVMDGYLFGDGSYDKKNDRWKLGFARNESLASDLRTLSARLGYTLTLNPFSRTNTDPSGKKAKGEFYEGRVILHGRNANHSSSRDRCEIVSIEKSRCREFFDISVEDDPHLFSLASGVLTHNSFPGSNRNMTGLFWDTVDNFFIDPDCNDPLLESAQWIARRHVDTVRDVEKRFDYAQGSLDSHGNLSSNENKVMTLNGRAINEMHMTTGKSHDLIVWYEIWSKGGAGARKLSERSGLTTPFDNVIGDYAYVCIAPSIPHPLNAPPDFIASAPDDQIAEAFSWPLPSYADSRWPVSILDFYPTVPMQEVEFPACWPLAPLAPGMGYLVSMNALMCALIERGYDSREQIIGYLDDCAKEFETNVINNTSSRKYVKLNASVQKGVSDMISYIQQLPLNVDLIQALEYCGAGFERSTGLTEFLSAATSTQSRSAADTRSKDERASIRPEKMGMDVAHWITVASEMEKFLAAMHVTGEDVRPLVGQAGAMLWDQLIGAADLELILREMKSTIEASDLRKPNKNREAENLQSMMQFMLPLLQQYAMGTSQVGPINSFIEALGEAIELDTSGWVLPEPWLPQVDPEQQQMQQQQMQMQMQAAGLEVAGKEADVEGKKAQATAKLLDMLAKQSGGELEGEQEKHDLGLIQSQETHEQQMNQAAQKHLLEVIEKQQKMSQTAAEFQFQRGVRESAKKAG